LAQGGASDITVRDADGNIYKTVKIGKQVWMEENLRTTKYNDGSSIPLVTDNVQWDKNTTGAYCYYNNTTQVDSINKFGALYNWYAVDTKKLAPAGWHVPTDEDWGILQNYLTANGFNWDGTKSGNKIAKSLSAKTDWSKSSKPGAIGNDLSKNNKSGFSALPGGDRYGDGRFVRMGANGRFWCATEAAAAYSYYRHLYYGYSHLYRGIIYKNSGFSVRLIKD
jgi:uncharacterized protein (TIGR02145 family)